MTGITTLADRCYIRLETGIVRGELLPGAKLPMAMLRTYLNVGLSPIREALSRLMHTGLVVCEGNKGFCVSSISETDVRDLYRTFTQIQCLTLRQSIELGGAEWEAQVVAALHLLSRVECAEILPSYEEWNVPNEAFHRALIGACDSPSLLKISDELWLRFERYCRLAFDLEAVPLRVNHDEHARLAKLVLSRDIDSACELLRYHICDALEDVIKLLKTKHGMA